MEICPRVYLSVKWVSNHVQVSRCLDVCVCVCVQMWLHTLGVHVCAWGVCVHLCAGEGVSSMVWRSMALDPCCTHGEKSQPLIGPILGEASVL